MLYCRQCSITALPGHRYCGKCGAKLEWRLSGTRKKISIIAFVLAVLSWAYLLFLFRVEVVADYLGGRCSLFSLRSIFLVSPFLLILLAVILTKKMPRLFARNTRIKAILYLTLAGLVFAASAYSMRDLINSELLALQLHPPGIYVWGAQKERTWGSVPPTSIPGTTPAQSQTQTEKKVELPPTTVAPNINQEVKKEQPPIEKIVYTRTRGQWLIKKYLLYLSSVIYLLSIAGIVLSYILERRTDFATRPTSSETTKATG